MTQLTHATGQIIDVPDSAAEFYTTHHWTPYTPPVETPGPAWTAARIDSWAAEQGVDLSGAKTKQDKLDLIAKASDAKEETDATGTREASAVPATEPAAGE